MSFTIDYRVYFCKSYSSIFDLSVIVNLTDIWVVDYNYSIFKIVFNKQWHVLCRSPLLIFIFLYLWFFLANVQ